MAKVESFTITATQVLIAPPAGKSVRLLAFYYEVDPDWTAGNIFAFRYGLPAEHGATENHYPRSTAGIAAMNLVGKAAKRNTLPPDHPLVGYISAGTDPVFITVTYEIV